MTMPDTERELDTLRTEIKRLREAMQAEHFRSNGSSAYMNPFEHERSVMRCQHPLCLAYKAR